MPVGNGHNGMSGRKRKFPAQHQPMEPPSAFGLGLQPGLFEASMLGPFGLGFPQASFLAPRPLMPHMFPGMGPPLGRFRGPPMRPFMRPLQQQQQPGGRGPGLGRGRGGLNGGPHGRGGRNGGGHMRPAQQRKEEPVGEEPDQALLPEGTAMRPPLAKAVEAAGCARAAPAQTLSDQPRQAIAMDGRGMSERAGEAACSKLAGPPKHNHAMPAPGPEPAPAETPAQDITVPAGRPPAAQPTAPVAAGTMQAPAHFAAAPQEPARQVAAAMQQISISTPASVKQLPAAVGPVTAAPEPAPPASVAADSPMQPTRSTAVPAEQSLQLSSMPQQHLQAPAEVAVATRKITRPVTIASAPADVTMQQASVPEAGNGRAYPAGALAQAGIAARNTHAGQGGTHAEQAPQTAAAAVHGNPAPVIPAVMAHADLGVPDADAMEAAEDDVDVDDGSTKEAAAAAAEMDIAAHADNGLADVLIWRREQWRGPSPCEHLQDWAQHNALPLPCYAVRGDTPQYQAACILPQSGIQIAPVRAFVTAEDAEQNAALLALVQLEGGLGEPTAQHCSVIKVGQPALPGWTPVPALTPDQAALRCLLDERIEGLTTQLGALHREYALRKAMLKRALEAAAGQAAALAEGGAPAQAAADALHRSLTDGGLEGQQEGPHRDEMEAAHEAAVAVVPPPVKGPVQELKEHCDKQRWLPPAYDFEPAREGPGFTCRLNLLDAGVLGLVGGVHPNQKAAKAEVAAKGMQAVRELPLLSS